MTGHHAAADAEEAVAITDRAQKAGLKEEHAPEPGADYYTS